MLIVVTQTYNKNILPEVKVTLINSTACPADGRVTKIPELELLLHFAILHVCLIFLLNKINEKYIVQL